tara:strand:- start:1917 stop:2789 length:873 start_codon:yes stop_codon:yes gene_type:complete
MTHYSLLVGSGAGGLPATSFVILAPGSSTFSVPSGYNAIHIEYAVGGGGGAICGADYDSVGGESQGPGGGSSGFISDKIITVTAGETITYAVGAAGTQGDATRGPPVTGNRYSTTAGNGGNTTLTGNSSGSLISLTGGGGSSASGGSVSGPLRTNVAGEEGSATINGTAITSGIFTDTDNSVKNVTSNTSGPTSTFNSSGQGVGGSITGSGNCVGDNCRISGGNGGSTYTTELTAIQGGLGGSSSGAGTNGTAGTRGAGGGGGAAQTSNAFTNGSAGGPGEMKYRFLQVI